MLYEHFDALTSYDKAISIDEKNTAAYFEKGLCLNSMGHF